MNFNIPFIVKEFDELIESVVSVRDELIDSTMGDPKEQLHLDGEYLASLTDDMHRQVHKVIGLFDLSETPAGELAFTPDDTRYDDWG